MGDWASFFDAGVAKWATRVLSALGFSWVTYEGLDAAWQGVVSNVSGAWSGIIGPVAQIVALTGLGEAIGIMMGGFSGLLVFLAFKHLAAVQS